MPLIVQDNTGEVVDANAYIDVTFFDTHAAMFGFLDTSWTTSQKEVAIISGTSYMDMEWAFTGFNRGFISTPLATNQSTELPRVETYVYLPGRSTAVPIGAISTLIKRANAEFALASIKGELYDNGVDKSIISETKFAVVVEKSVTYDKDARKKIVHSQHVLNGKKYLERSGILMQQLGVL